MSSNEFDDASHSLITSPLVAVAVIFPVLSALSVWGRFAARRKCRQPLQADDWWLLFSWVRLQLLERSVVPRSLLTCISLYPLV